MQPLIEASLKMESARRFVRSLCVDHCQRLWVASEQEETENPEGGVECFDQSAPQLHQWTQFTIQDGLGDDKATAVACDHEGRIWVGHSGNHGVSVYNGQRWQNYSNVAIPTGPSSLLGPLGETVAHIAVSPLDGDIWIATDCGLTRYSDSKGTWTIYGLPAGQATSLAFDRKGNIYAATKNDGIAMASAADNYQSWRRATAPDTSPMTTSGSGLPSNSINDILAAEAGTIYAATDAGLAWSKDDGGGWQFIRGWDGAEKIRRQGGTPSPDAGQPQTGSDAPPSVVLAEDYCSCLAEVCAAESLKGQICIGHRQSGVDLFDPPSNRITNVTPPTFARAFAAAKETFVGSYGPQHHAPYPRPGGVIALDVTANERAAPRTAAGLRLAGFPSGAPPVGNQLLQPEIELGNLKNLYLAGHFEELLSRCKRAERDQRYADRQPQLLYLEWVTDRTLGNSPESDQVEAIFLQRYPRQAFAAEIYYAEALELLANGRYKAANDKFATIVTYFPQSALAAKSIEIRDRLLLSTARPLERIWPIFERRGARGPLAQHN
jgi:hypothetical protein